MCAADDATGAAADWLKAVANQKIDDSPREHAMGVRFILRMWSRRATEYYKLRILQSVASLRRV